MSKFLLISIFVLALAGCASPSERAANIAANDDAACEAYGAAPGSQAYFQCRMAKDQQRQANNAAIVGAMLSRPQPQPYQPQLAPMLPSSGSVLVPYGR